MLWLTTFAFFTLGLWKLCEHRAISDVKQTAGGWPPSVVLPYVLRVSKSDNVTIRESYHLWALGYVVRVPYSIERPYDSGLILTVRPRILIQPEDEISVSGFDSMR